MVVEYLCPVSVINYLLLLRMTNVISQKKKGMTNVLTRKEKTNEHAPSLASLPGYQRPGLCHFVFYFSF